MVEQGPDSLFYISVYCPASDSIFVGWGKDNKATAELFEEMEITDKRTGKYLRSISLRESYGGQVEV